MGANRRGSISRDDAIWIVAGILGQEPNSFVLSSDALGGDHDGDGLWRVCAPCFASAFATSGAPSREWKARGGDGGTAAGGGSGARGESSQERVSGEHEP